jgi:hypothetical protein
VVPSIANPLFGHLIVVPLLPSILPHPPHPTPTPTPPAQLPTRALQLARSLSVLDAGAVLSSASVVSRGDRLRKLRQQLVVEPTASLEEFASGTVAKPVDTDVRGGGQGRTWVVRLSVSPRAPAPPVAGEAGAEHVFFRVMACEARVSWWSAMGVWVLVLSPGERGAKQS